MRAKVFQNSGLNGSEPRRDKMPVREKQLAKAKTGTSGEYCKEKWERKKRGTKKTGISQKKV